MTTDRWAILLAGFAATLLTGTAAGQTEPIRGLESLQAAPVPVPPPPVIVLPTPTPTPTPTQTPAASATPVARPRTRPTATSRAIPEAPASPPTPMATPTAHVGAPSTPAPVAILAPTPAATGAPPRVPTPSPQAEPALAEPETARTMPIWILPAVIVLVLAGLWALNRRRGAAPERVAAPEPIEPVREPAAEPAPELAVAAIAAAPQFLERPVAAAPRARLTVEMRPLRAGLNLLSAVADCELTVTNTGDAPAEAIRTQVTLLTAHTALDADLAALTAAPIGRPSTPPFTLAPGETRTIKVIAATPRDAIRTMTAANRPMFVPIVSVNLLYPDGQTTRAWAIGIERVDSAKLAPFWLDAPPKMYTDIGARPHAAAFER